MKILFLVSHEAEQAPLLSKYRFHLVSSSPVKHLYQFVAFEDKYTHHVIFLGQTGIGKVNTTYTLTTLLNYYHFDLVVNFGTCGFYPSDTDNFKKLLAQPCLPSSFIFFDIDLTDFKYPYGTLTGLKKQYYPDANLLTCLTNNFHLATFPLASGDSFVKIHNLAQYTNLAPNMLIDMEATSCAAVCDWHQIKFISFKIISNFIIQKNNFKQHEQLKPLWQDALSKWFLKLVEYLTTL